MASMSIVRRYAAPLRLNPRLQQLSYDLLERGSLSSGESFRLSPQIERKPHMQAGEVVCGVTGMSHGTNVTVDQRCVKPPNVTSVCLTQANDIEQVDTMTPGDAIRAWRSYRGWTQDQLADRAAVARQTIVRTESSKGTKPSSDTQEKLAAALGITPSELLAGPPIVRESTPPYGNTDVPRPEHVVDIPLYDTVPAGGWSDAATQSAETFPVLHHLVRGDRVVVRVAGMSMYPTLRDGDLVLIDRSRAVAKSGEIVLVEHQGARTLKRFRRIKKVRILRSDNHNYPDIEVEEHEGITLLGVAVRLVDRDLTKREL